MPLLYDDPVCNNEACTVYIDPPHQKSLSIAGAGWGRSVGSVCAGGVKYMRWFCECGLPGALQTTVVRALSYRRVGGGDLVW